MGGIVVKNMIRDMRNVK